MAKRPYEKLVLFGVSTCGLGGNDLGGDEKEICLLSWQVIDTTKIQPETQVELCYVRPDNLPDEATTTMGISIEDFSQAPSLTEGLEKFQTAMSSYSDKNWCIVTNGSHPLRQALFPEITKKMLSVPQYMYRYFDVLKEICKRTNSEFQPQNLFDLCEYLSIDTPSSNLYGQEEINVLANVVQKMVSQGNVFESPEMIQQHYQHSNQVNSGDVCKGCVVRLRGLLFSADHKDVAGFLSGLNIIPGGLVFNINQFGRRTGEAIVVIENEEQTLLALQRDHHYMQQRYIEVYEATPEEFMELSDSGNDVNDGVAFVVRMQGLPYRATESDITDFFGPEAKLKNGEGGVLIVRYPDGKASGDAFSLFSSDKDMQQALKKHKHDMMGRYIELFTSSLKEFLVVLNKSGTPDQLEQFSFLNPNTSSATSVIAAKRGSERNCVKLRGLPWEATPEDVIEFFGDLNKNIEQHGVHMVLNAQNRPTGDCYVQMTSVDSASKAADRLHRRNLGRRYIEVFQCSGNEVTYALMDSAGGRSGGTNPYHSGGGKRRRSSGATIKARGLPYSTNEYDLVDFFVDFHIDESDIEIIYNQSGKSTGVAYIVFPSQADARRAVRDLNHKYIGRRYIELSLA